MQLNSFSSNLKFNFGEIEEFIEPNESEIVYRYFRNEEDRDNFLRGNVRFSGPNTNRFFLDEQNDFEGSLSRCNRNNDEFEYRNEAGTFLFEYALSFSKEVLKPNLPNIKLTNIRGFIREIIGAIKNTTLDHLVSWHPLNQLEKYKEVVPSIGYINGYPVKSDEMVILHLSGVSGREVVYVDKSKNPSDSIESAKNARNQNKKFEDEKEYRIHLTGDFMGNNRQLSNLVKHIMVRCPSVRKYCEII